MDNNTTQAEYQTSQNHNKTQPAWSYSYGTICGADHAVDGKFYSI